MLRKITILFCFVCLLSSKAQTATALAFGDTVTQGVQKANGKDADKRDDKDDDDDSRDGDDSGSGGDSDDDSDNDDNSGSSNGGNSGSDDDDDSDSGSGNNDAEDDDTDSDDGGSEGDDGDNGSGKDDNDDNSGNGNGDDDGNDNSDDEDNDDGNSGKGNDNDAQKDNLDKDKDDDYEHRYYVGAVSASDGKSVLMGGTRLESTSPWLEVLSTGVWFEAYGYWQGNSFVAEDITILEDEAWSYFRGPASLVGVRAKGNVEVWTKTSGIDTRLTSSEQVRLVAYFDGSQYRSLPAGLTPPTTNVPTGWVELTGTYDGQTIVWDAAQAFP